MRVTDSITLTDLELTRFFFAIVWLLAFSHFFGHLFHRYKLPRVIGEISGGFLLGPTVLGFFLPTVHNWLFNAFPVEGKLISIVYWFGLVLLMFISGFEIQKSFSGGDRKLILAVLLGSTLVPFPAGWLAPSVYDFSPYIGTKNNALALQIVVAVAVAVTSIPVLSKMFVDLNIIHTRFAKIVLTAATLHDVILWVALAIATGLVSSEGVRSADILSTVVITLAFFGLVLAVMPRLIRFSNSLRYNLVIKSSVSGYALLICFLFAAVASLLNVNVVFGAFLAGLVIGVMPQERFEKEKAHIKEIALAFFVPIYFATVGLKLDLIHHFAGTFFLGFLAFASVFETAGTLIGARLVRTDWLSSCNLGVAMNTRGGPGIVLATIAFDQGIINETFFVTLVLTAIATSLLAGCWFRYVLGRGWPLLTSAPNS